MYYDIITKLSILLAMFFRLIQTSTTGVKQTLGKFDGLCSPGINFMIPFVQRIVPISNKIQHKDFVFRSKTKDNVFTELHLGVQLQILPEDTEKAFFRLQDPSKQIDSYVQNIVIAQVPKMTLDELFESQGTIGASVSQHLKVRMSEFGYTIIDTLVTKIVPDKEVESSMNKINASERLKQAAKNEADANYIREIRQAEADRDRKILQGEGISGQRLAILKGYETGVENMAKNLGLTPKDIIDFVMKTQHLDAVEAIGKSPNAKTIFMSHDPDGSSLKLTENLMLSSEKN